MSHRHKLPIKNGRSLISSHYTYGQVARLVGVGNQSVRDRIASGKATRVVIAGVNMLSREDLAAWLAEREQGAIV